MKTSQLKPRSPPKAARRVTLEPLLPRSFSHPTFSGLVGVSWGTHAALDPPQPQAALCIPHSWLRAHAFRSP